MNAFKAIRPAELIEGAKSAWNLYNPAAIGEKAFIDTIAVTLLVFGVFSFISLAILKINAPYGRYSKDGWGFLVPARIAWILQESPVVFMCIVYYVAGAEGIADRPANQILLALLFFHYFNRTFIFPFRVRGGKPTPVSIMIMAFAYCFLNGYVQARYLTQFATYPVGYHTSPQFLVGIAVFFAGMAINWHADHVLINLRKPGETNYKIPRGGMFRFVSGANFFGEIVEWAGFAIAAGSIPAASFALFTFCNIGPRGMQHHQWYLSKFEDYPKNRRAVIPFIW